MGFRDRLDGDDNDDEDYDDGDGDPLTYSEMKRFPERSTEKGTAEAVMTVDNVGGRKNRNRPLLRVGRVGLEVSSARPPFLGLFRFRTNVSD